MSSINGLSHIGVVTDDMEKSISFYRDTLGLTLETHYKNPRVELAFLRVGDCVIELIYKNGAEPPRQRGPVDHVAFAVTGIGELVETLKQKGVQFETETTNTMPDLFGGSTNIFLRGPSGEMVEFFEIN